MQATLTVLGSGTSMGVPTLGCDCRVCSSVDPHDRRTRPSVMVAYNGRVVLIDTTPDFHAQAIRERISRVDAVFYTHSHADHILGLDDLRPLSFRHENGSVPLYAQAGTAKDIRSVFKYVFDRDPYYATLAKVHIEELDGVVDLFGARFEPVEVIHGRQTILGYRFGSAAYLTDFSEIPDRSKAKLRNLDILFLDALRHRPHPTHSNVANSLKLVEELKPKRAFFTHISHDLPHEETNAGFPANVRLAYDGLRLEFEI
jgi:phosphoribosyl 1,2-cyclic phosphate phosphodiesterase